MFNICSSCGKEVLFLAEPVYDGFKKTGEILTCPTCGFTADAAPCSAAPKADPLAALFGDDHRPETVDLFDVEAETAKSCRKCTHYVIHPFTQRCGLHDREVSATDCCSDFEIGD
jgi:DNA-directed RNA polymerase subunit RPC12/RpoP